MDTLTNKVRENPSAKIEESFSDGALNPAVVEVAVHCDDKVLASFGNSAQDEWL